MGNTTRPHERAGDTVRAGSDRLHRLFEPRSIVVVGASTSPSKRGNQAIRALREAEFKGDLYAVNPSGGSAYGTDFLTSIDQIPVGVDVALISLPAALTPTAIRELGARDVAAAVVLANGFGELGTSAGKALDQELRAAVAETGVRVVGPNTSGILHVPLGANLVGLPAVKSGPISVVTQSGNMLLSLVADDAAHHGPGFASYIGLGNQADISYAECVEQLALDPHTGAIALHCEGLTAGRHFLEAVAGASARRPVVMLRGGRSSVGQRTALSHTGSVAGPDNVAVAVLRQAGVELVERSDELAVVAGVLATAPPVPAGTGIAILSDGGGHATLAADALEAHGAPLAVLADATAERLRQLLGGSAQIANPIDVAGATDTNPELFAEAVNVLLADPGVGMILVIGLYGGYHVRFDPDLEEEEDRAAHRLVGAVSGAEKALVVQSCYAAQDLRNHHILRVGGVPVLASIDHAVRAAAALVNRGRRLATLDQRSPLALPPQRTLPRREGGVLDEPEGRQLVEGAGIDLGPWATAGSPEELERVIDQIGRPCAVKVVSPQVVHKSESGGVALTVTTQDARATWDRITSDVREHVPHAHISAMVVTPMAPQGVELLVGATRDPIFGPVVAFGSGGVMVEALRDVSFRAAPFTHLEARELIDETMASRMLDGYRHLKPVDRDRLADLLVRVGDLVAQYPDLDELDLNPVIAGQDALIPVDVRIALATDPDQPHETDHHEITED